MLVPREREKIPAVFPLVNSGKRSHIFGLQREGGVSRSCAAIIGLINVLRFDRFLVVMKGVVLLEIYRVGSAMAGRHWAGCLVVHGWSVECKERDGGAWEVGKW